MLRTSFWWRNRAYIVWMGMSAVSSWLKKPPPAPFFSSTPTTRKFALADLDRLADGVLVAEEVGDHVLAEHHDVALGPVVLLGEERAAGHVPVAHERVVGRWCPPAEVCQLFFWYFSCWRLLISGSTPTMFGTLGLDRGRVVDREGARPSRSPARTPPTFALPGRDGEEVAAQALDPLRDPRGGALADGDHGDHRADADEDAEDGEHGAHLVLQQRAGGGADVLPQLARG